MEKLSREELPSTGEQVSLDQVRQLTDIAEGALALGRNKDAKVTAEFVYRLINGDETTLDNPEFNEASLRARRLAYEAWDALPQAEKPGKLSGAVLLEAAARRSHQVT